MRIGHGYDVHRLVEAGKQFEMQIYPDENHFIRKGNSYRHLYQRMKLFLDKNLLQADSLSFHPNDCRGTVVIKREDFERYLQCVGNEVEWIELY